MQIIALIGGIQAIFNSRPNRQPETNSCLVESMQGNHRKNYQKYSGIGIQHVFEAKVSCISLTPLWNEIVDLGLDGLCLGKGRFCTRRPDFCSWSSEGGMNAKRKVTRNCSIKQPCSSLPLITIEAKYANYLSLTFPNPIIMWFREENEAPIHQGPSSCFQLQLFGALAAGVLEKSCSCPCSLSFPASEEPKAAPKAEAKAEAKVESSCCCFCCCWKLEVGNEFLFQPFCCFLKNVRDRLSFPNNHVQVTC